MSQLDLESLPPELVRLLDAERLRPPPPASMQSRVLERFGCELLDVALAPSPVPVSSPPVGVAASPSGLLRLRHIPLAVTLLAAGGLGGAWLHGRLPKPPQSQNQSLAADAAAPSEADSMPVAAGSSVDALAPINAIAPTKVEPHRERAPGHRIPASTAPAAPAVLLPDSAASNQVQLERDRELAAERALIEQARTALSRGNAKDALALLAQHEHVFAQGRLVEEREVLEILCLRADRQIEKARALATKFRQHYPRSMLLRTVDAVFESPP